MSLASISLIPNNILTQLPILFVLCNTIIGNDISFFGSDMEVDACPDICEVGLEVNWIVPLLPFFGHVNLKLLVIYSGLTEVDLVFVACDIGGSPGIHRVLLCLLVYSRILRLVKQICCLVATIRLNILVIHLEHLHANHSEVYLWLGGMDGNTTDLDSVVAEMTTEIGGVVLALVMVVVLEVRNSP